MGSILDDLGNLWNAVSQAGTGAIHSIEDAITHLGSLGVPYFASLPQFIQFLVTYGENPFTFLPALVSHITSKGGNPVPILEELAGGFINEGPQIYTQKQATKVITPIISTLQQHTQTASALGSLHQETITQVKGKLTALRQNTNGTPGLQGDFALALDKNFAIAEKNMATLTGPFGIQLSDPWPVFQQNFAQINQRFVGGLEQVPTMVKNFALFDMAVIAAEAAIDVPIAIFSLGIGDIGAIPIEGSLDVVLVAGEIIIIGVWVIGDALIWALCCIAALAALGIEELIYQPSHAANSSTAPLKGVQIAPARSHQNDLPVGVSGPGKRIYVPPKSVHGDPARAWDNTKKGFRDAYGNVWVWAPAGAQHGGPHWDVQHPDGSHTNVTPDGTVIGPDNFPNK